MARAAAAAVVLALAGAAAGCGLGAGAKSAQGAQLRVTRDYGAEQLVAPVAQRVAESETAIRLLERHADVTTRYSGRFVQSVQGVAGGGSGGHADWFFYVNGIESPSGGADYRVRGGDRVWWDYRDWRAAMSVPAVVGSWPEPFLHGFAGRRWPVAVVCRAPVAVCATVRARMRAAGVAAARRAGSEALRVFVGPWSRLRGEEGVAAVERGPAESGVFARFARVKGGWALQALDDRGEVRERLGPGAGLVAAVGRQVAQLGAFPGGSGVTPPAWLVTGTDTAGVRAAAALLDVPDLAGRYAVVVRGGHPMEVPVP